jgi:hypothetical protein
VNGDAVWLDDDDERGGPRSSTAGESQAKLL